MPNTHPYFSLNNTKEVLKSYKQALGATNIHRVLVSGEQAKQFNVLDTTIMAADDFQKENWAYSGISILLSLNSEDEGAMEKVE